MYSVLGKYATRFFKLESSYIVDCTQEDYTCFELFYIMHSRYKLQNDTVAMHPP